jgi:hypothetical protein
MTCLLWEKVAFESGDSVVREIRKLVPLVDAELVGKLAVEARYIQQLRHVPLFLTVQMFKIPSYRKEAGKALEEIIRRPDEVGEWIAIYWKENGGRKMIPAQAKKALSAAFLKFNEYGLAKWNRDRDIRLIDAMRLVHPFPSTERAKELFSKVKLGTLATPYTWEVELSKGRDRKEVWTEMLQRKALGGQALLKNLRNMENANVDIDLIKDAIVNNGSPWLLPLDFLRAAKAAPRFEHELETRMMKTLQDLPKLHGKTALAVDMSGSMNAAISKDGEFRRHDAAAALAMIAVEMCDDIDIYLTAGIWRDMKSIPIPTVHGFDLTNYIDRRYSEPKIGGNGIFTRRFLNWLRPRYSTQPERIIIISDSQDVDHNHTLPEPFGRWNHIVDVSNNKRGINYAGIWSSEVNGWSQYYIHYIHAIEALGDAL